MITGMLHFRALSQLILLDLPRPALVAGILKVTVLYPVAVTALHKLPFFGGTLQVDCRLFGEVEAWSLFWILRTLTSIHMQLLYYNGLMHDEDLNADYLLC